jgi:hypothetical protein
MKGEHMQVGGISKKGNRSSAEISLTLFLKVKKIGGSKFSLKVSNTIVTKIPSAIFEGLIAYLGKDFNRPHEDATTYPPYCISKTNCDTLY